jgi:hypothetical protein
MGGTFGRRMMVQGHRLMGVAAEAADLKVEMSCVQRVPQRRGGLRWPLVPKHALVPSFASERVGFLPRLGGAFR